MTPKTRKVRNTTIDTRLLALAVFLVITGTAIRFWWLGRHSLWLDEGFTAMFTSREFSFLVDNCLHDRGPLPLMYLFPWIAQKITGTNTEFTLRFFDCVFGCAGLVVMLFLARRIHPEPLHWLLAVLFLAFSAVHHEYSRDARGYPALVLLSMVQFSVLWTALWEDKRQLLWWFLYYLSVTAALYITLFSLFLVVGNVLWFAWFVFVLNPQQLPPEKKIQKTLMLAAMTFLILCSIGFWLMFSLPMMDSADTAFEKMPVYRTLLFFGYAFQELSGGHIISALAALGVIVSGMVFGTCRQRSILGYPFFILLAVFIIYQFSPITPAFLHVRYVTLCLPFIIIAFSLSLCRLKDTIPQQTMNRIIIAGFILLYLFFNAGGIYRNFTIPQQDWRTAGNYIADHYERGDILYSGLNSVSVVLFYYLPAPIKYTLPPDSPSTRELEVSARRARQVWFVSGYYRWDYPWQANPGGDKATLRYFDWLDEHYHLARVIPGENPIHIFTAHPLDTTE